MQVFSKTADVDNAETHPRPKLWMDIWRRCKMLSAQPHGVCCSFGDTHVADIYHFQHTSQAPFSSKNVAFIVAQLGCILQHYMVKHSVTVTRARRVERSIRRSEGMTYGELPSRRIPCCKVGFVYFRNAKTTNGRFKLGGILPLCCQGVKARSSITPRKRNLH